MRRTPIRQVSKKREARNREYSKVREAVAARDLCEAKVPGVCQGRGVHAHHILRRSQGGMDTPDNLAWLCGPCHGHVHQHPEWAFGVGLLRRRPA